MPGRQDRAERTRSGRSNGIGRDLRTVREFSRHREAPPITPDLTAWLVFAAVVVGGLVIDLAVVHRNLHAVTLGEAATWSAIWIAVALLFGAGVWIWFGHDRGLEYYTGWLIEKALSVDNIFVFVVLFRYFDVPARFQHRVLFWGVLGAIVLRGVFITMGIALLREFHWLVYVLGAFLVFTGVRLALAREQHMEPATNPVLRLLRRLLPITADYHGQRFTVRDPRFAVTPLFVVLVMVETTDLVFALDSIPAILAITRHKFVVYTSNVFAILGLRSLYFLVARAMERLTYLRFGLALILAFVGVKMFASAFVHVPVMISLAIILTVLAGTVAASVITTKGADSP
jgi:tellurite resistance protein TerC